jgi:sulfonate transport system permease protein
MSTTLNETPMELLEPGTDQVPTAPGDSRRGRRRGRLGPGRRVPFLRAIGPLLLLGFWSLASGLKWLDPTVLPSPWDVASTGWRMARDGTLGSSLEVSVRRAMLGLVIGVTAGLVLALASGLTRIGTALIDGTVQIWRSVPILAVIPIAIVWIGIGEEMKVSLIALAVMVPIYINTTSALAGIDLRYVELSESLNLSRWHFVRYVALPGAIPGFFVGLRLSAVSCWLVLVVVEQTNATAGIGYFMSTAETYGQVDVLTVGLALYALLGLGSDTIVQMAERRVLVWRKSLGK